MLQEGRAGQTDMKGPEMDVTVLKHQPWTPVRPSSEARCRPPHFNPGVTAGMSIEWAGDDPGRKGLHGTPERGARACGRCSKSLRHPSPMVFSPC